MNFASLLTINNNLPNEISGLLSSPQKWSFVNERFLKLLQNIEPTDLQKEDVTKKAANIICRLDNYYWDSLDDSYTTAVVAGSWSKGTRIRGSSDLDIIYLLPWQMWTRFESRKGNKQSSILQEVKEVLAASYPNTEIRSDGPAIILDFVSYKVEVVPAFLDPYSPMLISDPQFKVWVCETKDNGRYKLSAPAAEYHNILFYDTCWHGELTALIRMAKTWKQHCNAPIKTIYLQELALEFLKNWPNTGKGWYDWMVRDFFAFMYSRQNGLAFLPVSNQPLFYGSDWKSKVVSAYKNANAACQYEENNWIFLAGAEWQKIFGNAIPQGNIL